MAKDIVQFQSPEGSSITITQGIALEAMGEIVQKYGDGAGIKGQQKDLAYHNIKHTKRVIAASEKIANELGMNPTDQQLLVMVAASHDVIHEADETGSAEERSTQWLMYHMKQSSFSPEDIEIARLAILGTIWSLDSDNDVFCQQFTQTDFPSERGLNIGMCVASADFEALCAPYGAQVAHDLFKELHGYGSTDIPTTLTGLREFQAVQVSLLQTYSYPYPGTEILQGNLRQAAIQYHRQLAKDIDSGVVGTWQDVVKRDTEFIMLNR